jgi:TolB protein
MERILFTNRRTCLPERTEASEKVGMVNLDGTGLRHIDFGKFEIPNAIVWGRTSAFSDGRRWVMVSHHFLKPISKDTPFDKTVDVKLWIYDLVTDELTPVEPYGDYDCCYVSGTGIMPGEEQIYVGLNLTDNPDTLWVAMDLDGGNKEEIIRPGLGFTHRPEFSPDGKQMATEFYVKEGGSRVSVIDREGKEVVHFPHNPGDFHFMPMWSPDGEWIHYVTYYHDIDPSHQRADLFIARPDGSEQHAITEDRPFWLSAVYGGPDSYGSGSNVPRWSPDGSTVTLLRIQPDSQEAWSPNPNPEYDDHFGLIFRPGRARGGTDICLLNPFTGDIRQLTDDGPGTWNFRPRWSKDGTKLAFCRAGVGEPSGLWVMNADGSVQRLLTHGYADKSADHPEWTGGERQASAVCTF